MNRIYCASLVLLLPGLLPTSARADILFESGTLGPTGIFIEEIDGEGDAPGGAVVSKFVFNGVRFELNQPAVTTRIGGHFVADPRFDISFFGAIVRLGGNADFPNSADLSSSDVLGATLLSFSESIGGGIWKSSTST